MTEQQKLHAADVLLGTKELLGGDDPKYLPKVFVVDGHCYMFLNAARRAAYGTELPIYVMTISDAWKIKHGETDTLDEKAVEWNFDQTGSTYGGRLYRELDSLLACMVPNQVIKMATGKSDLMTVLDLEINRMFMTTRAQNILMKTKCLTYRDLLKFTRHGMMHMRNVGVTTIAELDAEMERVGLNDHWKYNKSVI